MKKFARYQVFWSRKNRCKVFENVRYFDRLGDAKTFLEKRMEYINPRNWNGGTIYDLISGKFIVVNE